MEKGKSELFRHLLILLLLALVSQQAAKLIWSLTERPQIPSVSLTDLRQNDLTNGSPALSRGGNFEEEIVSLHLFGEPESVLNNELMATPVDVPETTLNLTLRGVIASSPMKMAIAVISEQGKNKGNDIYKVGDEVSGKAYLKAIYPDRVILERAGELETLFLENDRQKEKTSSFNSVNRDHMQIKRQYLTRKMENIPDLAKEVEMAGYHRNGKQYGYQLISAKNDQFLKNLGLQPGDILYEVNGIRLINTGNVMNAYETLQQDREIRLIIERDGQRQTKIYSIR
ncbi:MAG: type II secretion system protein GspC [Desulfobia sp.]